jgi:hypothetical protein
VLQSNKNEGTRVCHINPLSKTAFAGLMRRRLSVLLCRPLTKLKRSMGLYEQKLVLAAYLTDERRSTSSWVASLPYLPCPDGESLEAALLSCIKNASQGWDRVMMPGLELATALIDCTPRQGMKANLQCHVTWGSLFVTVSHALWVYQ